MEEIDLQIEEWLGKGGVQARLFIEAQGIDAEIVKKALQQLVDQLKKEPELFVYKADVDEVIQDRQTKKFTSLIEAELMAKNLRRLSQIVTRYGPSAVEVLAPESIKLSMSDAQDLLMDTSEVVSTLAHEVHKLRLKAGYKDPFAKSVE